jgi:hypothetical protein
MAELITHPRWEEAYSWLDALWRSKDQERFTLENDLQALLTAFLCEWYGEFDREDSLSTLIAEEIKNLDDHQGAIVSEFKEVDPLLFAITSTILKGKGIKIKGMNNHLEDLYADIERIVAEGHVGNAPIRFYALCHILGKIGMPEALSCIPQDFNTSISLPEIYESGLEKIQELCDKIDLITRYGEEPQVIEKGTVQILHDALPPIMFACFRNYKIEVGARLLRTLNYLGIRGRALEEGVAFLVFQQRSTGAFGYLNPLAKESAERYLGREVAFFLPMTLVSLWTLGECTTQKGALLNTPWLRKREPAR